MVGAKPCAEKKAPGPSHGVLVSQVDGLGADARFACVGGGQSCLVAARRDYPGAAIQGRKCDRAGQPAAAPDNQDDLVFNDSCGDPIMTNLISVNPGPPQGIGVSKNS